eukprot:7158962-Ditylum_brightwellii.AAC.1
MPQSMYDDIPFVCQEFAEKILARHIIILFYSTVKLLANLAISPAGPIPQPGHYPWLIYDYTTSSINPLIQLAVLPEAM